MGALRKADGQEGFGQKAAVLAKSAVNAAAGLVNGNGNGVHA